MQFSKLAILLGLFCLSGCSYFEAPAPSAGLVVIDTRSLAEYQRSHVEGAIHVPYDEVRALVERLPDDKSASLVVYCTVGVRAATAKKTLADLGYANIINAGGLRQMKNAGWAIATPSSG